MGKSYDTLIIGHICKDVNIFRDKVEHLSGGAVVHAAAAARATGIRVGVLTRTAPADAGLLDVFHLDKEDIHWLPSLGTTSIRNLYLSEDREHRECTALMTADPFSVRDVPEVEALQYHLAGLVAGDFDNGLVRELAHRGKVALDVQGFLRNAVDGRMVFRDWKEKTEYLPFVHFLKADAAEAEIMTGLSDRGEAARMLSAWGAREVMITHHSEVVLYDGSACRRLPLKPRNLSGRTGRGDTCFSAYVSERLNNGIPESLLYSAAMVSLKMETPGPFSGSRQDVLDYQEAFFNG